MGRHNRQRRADKQRQRAREDARRRAEGRGRAPGPPGGGAGPGWPGGPVGDEATTRAVYAALAQVVSGPSGTARREAAALAGPHALVPAPVTVLVSRFVAGGLTAAVRGGWRPSDLAEIARRRIGDVVGRALGVLAGLLAAEAARHPADRVAPEWRADLATLGEPADPRGRDVDTVAALLGLAALLSGLPTITALIPPPGAALAGKRPVAGGDARLLARVRALLAKAESTEFDDEADALTAKAQELISRHSLDRLLAEAQAADAPPSRGEVVARRLWIDAPYVSAKAMLVGAVAAANACRAVTSEALGFVTVVGDARDLDAVEVLVASLQVQASAAMLRCGRQADGRGVSRTASFRRSFLMSYASRIRERLLQAADEAAASTGRSGELVPVLRDKAERVDATLGELFPDLVYRERRIGNARGWAAGRAAADLAVLDTTEQIARAG